MKKALAIAALLALSTSAGAQAAQCRDARGNFIKNEAAKTRQVCKTPAANSQVRLSGREAGQITQSQPVLRPPDQRRPQLKFTMRRWARARPWPLGGSVPTSFLPQL
jgi:hypothetical protein